VNSGLASNNLNPLASLASAFFPSHLQFLFIGPVVFWLGE
jgi:hypothetical protein